MTSKELLKKLNEERENFKTVLNDTLSNDAELTYKLKFSYALPEDAVKIVKRVEKWDEEDKDSTFSCCGYNIEWRPAATAEIIPGIKLNFFSFGENGPTPVSYCKESHKYFKFSACGTGELIEAFIIAGVADPKYCFGIDFNSKLVKLTRERLKKYGVPEENIVLAEGNSRKSVEKPMNEFLSRNFDEETILIFPKNAVR